MIQTILNATSPIAFSMGSFTVRWYGISYLIGLLVGVWILITLNKKKTVFKNTDQIFDYAFWMFFVGVIIGGRLGYVLFYNLHYYFQNPAKIFAIWDGGMSFHGGLIGLILVSYFFLKKHKINFVDAADIIVIPGALALTFTRLANFVNRELYGRVIENINFKWLGVNFGDGLLRYPSQLFQSASAIILFLILWYIFTKKPKRGILLFSYLVFHGLFRFILEFWREPDSQLGFVLGPFTMGQILGFIVFVTGIIGLLWIGFRRRVSS